MKLLLDILIIISASILIVLILLQQRGGSFGSLFGFSGNLPFFQRRGLERYIFILTWIIAVIFLLLSLIRAYI